MKEKRTKKKKNNKKRNILCEEAGNPGHSETAINEKMKTENVIVTTVKVEPLNYATQSYDYGGSAKKQRLERYLKKIICNE